ARRGGSPPARPPARRRCTAAGPARRTWSSTLSSTPCRRRPTCPTTATCATTSSTCYGGRPRCSIPRPAPPARTGQGPAQPHFPRPAGARRRPRAGAARRRHPACRRGRPGPGDAAVPRRRCPSARRLRRVGGRRHCHAAAATLDPCCPTMTTDRDQPAVALDPGGPMPLLGFGTWQMTGGRCQAAVRHALEVGYRHLGTAAMGRNERDVGRAVRDSGVPREQVFVTTKLPPGDAGRERRTLDNSLRALGMDYVGVWLVHWPPPARALVSTWKELLAVGGQGVGGAV